MTEVRDAGRVRLGGGAAREGRAREMIPRPRKNAPAEGDWADSHRQDAVRAHLAQPIQPVEEGIDLRLDDALVHFRCRKRLVEKSAVFFEDLEDRLPRFGRVVDLEIRARLRLGLRHGREVL